MNTREEGKIGEERAVKFLEEKGVKICERNYRLRNGEIDIIGRDGDYLVFFEVKLRHRGGLESAGAAVTKEKQRTICAVSDHYRLKKMISEDTGIRYDVIAINDEGIEWYKNAFDYRGQGY
ncbi:MAG: YraN family protein [Lachnospiraceae bacterium]|nr:YraN family protein [Lachnospiraceae bacterium]